MSQFISLNQSALIPVQVVTVVFYEKEETSLSAFQTFILKAIESGSGVDEIAEATLLTKLVVESEILHMISQKLVLQEGDTLYLSDLSRKILMVTECVKSLNKEQKKLCINLMNGDLEAFDADQILSSRDETPLSFFPKISEYDIDGISVEENISFFEDYMEVFSSMAKDDIETVLNSVYVEFQSSGKIQFFRQNLIRVPCAIGDDLLKTDGEDLIFAKGSLYKITYRVVSDFVEANRNIVSQLTAVEDHNRDLISDMGQKLLQEYRVCLRYNQEALTCFYDTVSGRFSFEEPKCLAEGRGKANLNMPVFWDISENKKAEIIEALRTEQAIDACYDIQEVSCESSEYSVKCDFGDLGRSSDGQ